ncbi:uncharacterized protein PRCAT00002485001 [Priceomyces carsonii]|uniref:uncharacterized protein n=1 Tax=Priceomyces carsonii TaxID=28549 RepID=UPI002EDA8557|nr:unnamed protein product [Priceomyces carsonii]
MSQLENEFEKGEDVGSSSTEGELTSKSETNVNVVANTFLEFTSKDDVITQAERIIELSGLTEKAELIKKGALLVSFPNKTFKDYELSIEESESVKKYNKYPWKQTYTLYLLAITSALSAAVQGMDESAIGGAQLFYIYDYGISADTTYYANVRGIINAIPYLAASVIGCWLSIPMNFYLGRRMSIFLSSFVAAASGLWQAFSPSWEMLLVGRLIMGITIGVKSATVPVYTAESTPERIRGGLVMLWQTLTAFGVMMGSVMGVAFLNAGKHNWRFMLGSVFPLPLVVCALIFVPPESPRWLISKKRYRDAYESFTRLRPFELLAAKDFYYAVSLIEVENEATHGTTFYRRIIEIFTVPRNRFAALASCILMFGQQFCGVNVLTFYISTVLVSAGFSNHSALAGSCGFGALAVCGALTAIPIIDKKGRRFLVLFTYPLLAIFLLWTAFSFYAETEKSRLGLVLVGIYLHVYFYGIGSGPVPFTYNAESASLSVRDAHSSLGTATTWMFCFVLGFTLPNMQRSIKNVGVFCFYAGWCVVLFILILLFVPETKGYTLEELDLIFSVPIKKHAEFQVKKLLNFASKILGKDVKEQSSILDYALSLQFEKKKRGVP